MGEIWSIGELVENILSKITDAFTYKATRLVCINWFRASKDRVDKFSNHLQTILELYPNEDWNWFRLSCHPKIDLDFIKKHGEWSWNTEGLCINPSLNWNDLLSIMPIDSLKQNIHYVSSNPNLTVSEVSDNMSWSWHWAEIRKHNKNIINFIRKIPQIVDIDRLGNFHKNPLLYQIIKELPCLEWEVFTIYYDSKLSLPELVELFGQNTIDNIYAHDYVKYISINKMVPSDYPELYYFMTKHKEFNAEIIDRYPSHFWNWSCIASHPNISIEYLEKKNQCQYILGSPHITWRYMRDHYGKYKDKWYFDTEYYIPHP